MQLIQAKEIAHTLSNPSKMPGKAYSLPATECHVGARLRGVPGSVCEGCYAMKGAYAWRPTKQAMAKRLASIAHPQWVDAMVAQIKRQQWFRWHDSGDLQSVAHLAKIVAVAEQTPNTSHWLPTREKAIVKAYGRAGGTFPSNLVVRVSGAMVDGNAPKGFSNTSTVYESGDVIGKGCIAYRTKANGDVVSESEFQALKKAKALKDADLGHCGDCRACWDARVQNVSYHKH